MDTARATRADLLDPATIAALGRIEVTARWIVDGFLSGLHRSPRKGFSVEFAEHRPYQAGDEPRHVDWKLAARADRWAVKQYEEETNLRATVVLDVSRSMAWSGAATRLTKLAYAERLAAAIALLFLRQRDAVGLVRFDDVVRSSVPPRVRTGQWVRLVAALEEPGAGRASHAANALEAAGRLIARRGMVVLISDLLMDRDDVVADRARAAPRGTSGGRDARARSRGARPPAVERGAVRRPGERRRGRGDGGRCARRIQGDGARGDGGVAALVHGVRRVVRAGDHRCAVRRRAAPRILGAAGSAASGDAR